MLRRGSARQAQTTGACSWGDSDATLMCSPVDPLLPSNASYDKMYWSHLHGCWVRWVPVRWRNSRQVRERVRCLMSFLKKTERGVEGSRDHVADIVHPNYAASESSSAPDETARLLRSRYGTEWQTSSSSDLARRMRKSGCPESACCAFESARERSTMLEQSNSYETYQ